MAGTWLVNTEAVRRAMSAPPARIAAALGLAMRLRAAILADAPVAVHRPAALHLHVAVFLLAHARHAGGDLLEGLAVRGAQLGKEVDVAAGRDRPVEIAREHGLLLLLGHRPGVQVGALVRL